MKSEAGPKDSRPRSTGSPQGILPDSLASAAGLSLDVGEGLRIREEFVEALNNRSPVRERHDILRGGIASNQFSNPLGISLIESDHCVRIGEEIAKRLIVDANSVLSAFHRNMLEGRDEVYETLGGISIQTQDLLELWLATNDQDLFDLDLTDAARLAGDLELDLSPARGCLVHDFLRPLEVARWIRAEGPFFRFVEDLDDVARPLAEIPRGRKG